MAKKKKGEMETLMGMLEDMLGSFSPEQQIAIHGQDADGKKV